MKLKIAVQMDPIESVNIKGDSTFALMLAAQERGHEVFEYHVETLTLDADDRLFAQGFPVKVRKVQGDHFEKGAGVRLDLGKDIDVILMRQDPPFHMGYITATHLLERL
ncbi:MAG: glutathione synthase, partial [Pseudomonadota bacterium]